MLAFIPAPPARAIEIGPLDLTFYGILVASGVLLAMTMTRRRFVARGGDGEFADRVALRTVIMGFVGARLAYVLPRLDRFLDDPLSILAVWEGGLALFGGATLGLLTVVVMFRRERGDLRAFLDAMAPAVPAAQAVGRWGNYFNQELYGRPTDVPWALEVDPEFRVFPYQAFETFHPTFLYESLYNVALVFVLLWLERRARLPKGGLAMVYLIAYTLARFGLELLRTDTPYRLLGLSRNAWVSLAFGLAATVVLVLWTRRDRRREEQPEPEPESAEV
jgi:prolipoprotein diacylglyceryl transferase